MTRDYKGGCWCGALRYRVNDDLADTGFCHCRLCQRAHGAPVVVWSTVAREDFAYTQGEPHRLESTPGHWREFCSNCGTHLVFRPDAGDTLDVASLTLDEPVQVKPFFHIWTSSQWPGWAGAEALPRHAQEEP